jgi:thiamine monophosphate kinase
MAASNESLVAIRFQALNAQALEKAAQTIRAFREKRANKQELTVALRAVGARSAEQALRRMAAGAGKVAQETGKIGAAQDKVQAEIKQTSDAEARLRQQQLLEGRKRRAAIREEEAALKRLRAQSCSCS